MNLHSEEVTCKRETVVKSYGAPRSLKSPYIPWNSRTSLCKETHGMMQTRTSTMENDGDCSDEQLELQSGLQRRKPGQAYWERPNMLEKETRWINEEWMCEKRRLNLRRLSDSEAKSPSLVWVFATPWTVAYQAPPSMAFSRQEYWRGVPSPSLDPFATSTYNN